MFPLLRPALLPMSFTHSCSNAVASCLHPYLRNNQGCNSHLSAASTPDQDRQHSHLDQPAPLTEHQCTSVHELSIPRSMACVVLPKPCAVALAHSCHSSDGVAASLLAAQRPATRESSRIRPEIGPTLCGLLQLCQGRHDF